ncbi:venom acid phosphatase Acph-1-like [Phymastichus coffea]|uniref:venom acid phosphatase Acph-1-like n=1 Tax=Phymastichus coffea TaxID=108790 RepID=UPI00273C9276|nr:venom acid phosphatase Acph-1-like [Phymastichus coffea]
MASIFAPFVLRRLGKHARYTCVTDHRQTQTLSAVTAFYPSDDYQLELVQVLFRHGERISDKEEIYKTDPYDEVFKGYGYGQLTKAGHRREYRIGQLLRQRYGDFLGDFNNSHVYAYSTNSDRTKMSLQLVLAGLYPPTARTSWSDKINWLPIPTYYDKDEDNFLTVYYTCDEYLKLYHQVPRLPEMQEKLKKYQSFYNALQKKTGADTSTPYSVYLIYCNVRAALSLDLPLPDWCSKEDYKILEELTTIALQSYTHTPSMKRTTAGLIIQEFLKNTNGEDGRKIYLYGAHDINVAVFTNAHNFSGIPDIPDYGSTVIFEKLRGKDNQVYIRMFLWTGVSETLMPLKLDNCQQTCLLSDYTNIVKGLLPDDFTKRCTSRKNISIPNT